MRLGKSHIKVPAYLYSEAAFIGVEWEYLDSLQTLFSAIQHHGSALSSVASTLRKEMTSETQEPVSLLPIEAHPE